jgi:putative hemolysin
MDILKFNALNVLYDRHSHLPALDFIDAVLYDLGIRYIISASDSKRIPKNGPFIMIANHPLGAIDGLILLKVLLTHHPGSKILANFLLTRIKPLTNHIYPVNPFENHKAAFNSVSSLKSAMTHLKNGQPLGIFPAGEVSVRKPLFGGQVNDKDWEISALKLIKMAGVPIVPVYFHARNSELFYFLSGIDSNFRTAALASEIFRSKDKKVIVRVGKAISIDTNEKYNDISEFGAMLRRRTYMLSNAFNQPKYSDLKRIFVPSEKIRPVAVLQDDALCSDMKAIADTGAMLFEAGDYQMFFTRIVDYPIIKTELGRLRELTFRAVGEGTNKALDIDKYDDYYHHLILWDQKYQTIAGAYRLGLGQAILQKYGMRGFYLSELFRLSGPMQQMLSQSIEMGRAFVAPAYQQRTLPLFLLWKGIFQVIKNHTGYKYLIGAASISSHYSDYCKSVMVDYLKRHYMDQSLIKYVMPKKEFKSVLSAYDRDSISCLDMKAVDKMIEEIEPQGLKIPILIKKYLLQNAQVLGFNVDPAFNYCVDALMYIHVDDIEVEKLK